MKSRMEGLLLRQRLLRELALIWCGQDERVAARREAALRRILAHARRSVPYYRDLFAAAGVREPDVGDLARLPLLDKALARKHARELRSDDWRVRPHYDQTTTGTTGQPFEFIVDNLAAAVADVHQEFAFRLLGYRTGDRIAAFAGNRVPEEALRRGEYWARRGGAARELPYGSVCYSTHHIDPQTLPRYFEDLDHAGYRFLQGYPSGIHAVARYCLDSGRRLSRPLAAVQLTSEMTSAQQVADIEAAFDTRVFLQYGHTEASVFAHTFDRSREYLCSPLLGWVEVLDGDGRQVAAGEEGEIVVTGFHSRAMPFLRYKTGDRAVYGGERNELTVLRQVLGRNQDVVVRADGTRLSATGLLLAPLIEGIAHTERWQVVQDRPGAVTVRVVPRPTFSAAHEREIVDTYRRLGGIETTVERVAELPPGPGGKHAFFLSRLAPAARS